MSSAAAYSVAGNVLANGGLYVLRRADEELRSLCQEGTFAYILAPRQVGKSSVMARAARHLARAGFRAAVIDLNQLGGQLSADEWYLGHLLIMHDQLSLRTDVMEWWQRHVSLNPAQRMMAFFGEVLLGELAGPVVIFVDEVEKTRSLDFAGDFYAAIRGVYDARTYDTAFKRLSFVLVGTASPDELARDAPRSPFCVGCRVELTDFTLTEALPLADGLGLPREEARRALGWILEWTGGHPYLTQRLCRALVERDRASWCEQSVAQLVSETFFGKMCKSDDNLQATRGLLTREGPDMNEVMDLYRAVRRQSPPTRDANPAAESHLKVAGIVSGSGKDLRVRNRVYGRVFDEEWIDACLAASDAAAGAPAGAALKR